MKGIHKASMIAALFTAASMVGASEAIDEVIESAPMPKQQHKRHQGAKERARRLRQLARNATRET